MTVNVGRALGNWNDRANGVADMRSDRSLRWLLIDKIAGWLYVRGEQHGE
jgi:hypothetical protein